MGGSGAASTEPAKLDHESLKRVLSVYPDREAVDRHADLPESSAFLAQWPGGSSAVSTALPLAGPPDAGGLLVNAGELPALPEESNPGEGLAPASPSSSPKVDAVSRRIQEPSVLGEGFGTRRDTASTLSGVAGTRRGSRALQIGSAVDPLIAAAKIEQREAFLLAQAQTSDAFSVLTEGDQYRAAGEPVDAARNYLRVMDDHSGTAASVLAYTRLNELASEAISGQHSQAELQAFQNSLPAWEECNSAESKYILLGLAWTRAKEALKRGAKAEADGYNAQLREGVWRLMGEHPNDAVMAFAVPHLLEAGKDMSDGDWWTELKSLEAWLVTAPPSKASWVASALVGSYWSRDPGNWTNGFQLLSRMLAEFDAAGIQSALEDPGVLPGCKARFATLYGGALMGKDDYAGAMSIFDVVQLEYPDANHAADLAGYLYAVCNNRMNYDDPAESVMGFQRFMEAYPASEHCADALEQMASLYSLQADYESAAELFTRAIEDYPNSEAGKRAASSLAFIQDYALGTQVAIAPPALPANVLAQACGPIALHHVLLAKDIFVPVADLAELAGTDETGTSMLALADAALGYGVPMLGVETKDLDELEPPFIAYVNADHFVAVLEVEEKTLTIRDSAGPEQILARTPFEKAWMGLALVPSSQRNLAKTASVTGGSSAASTALLDLPGPLASRRQSEDAGKIPALPEESFNVDAVSRRVQEPSVSGEGFGTRRDTASTLIDPRVMGQLRGGNGSLGFYGGGKPAHNPAINNGPQPPGTWWGGNRTLVLGACRIPIKIGFGVGAAPQSALEQYIAQPWARETAGIPSYAGNAAIDQFFTSFDYWKTDFRIQSIGGIHLEIGRKYQNANGQRWGYHTGTHPIKTAIGIGWMFGLSMHAQVASDLSSIGIHFPDGRVVQYAYTSQDTNWRYYNKDRIKLQYSKITGAMILTDYDSTQYAFTAINGGGASGDLGRLNWVKDINANQMTLTYDSTNIDTGKLTRVDLPTSDGRYLTFTWTSGNMTRIDLKNSAGTILKYVEYAYNGSGELELVTEDDETVGIEYQYSTITHSTGDPRWISKITDKMANEYDIVFDYYSNTIAEGIAITRPDGTYSVYNRLVSNSEAITLTYEADDTEIERNYYVPVQDKAEMQDARFFYSSTEYEELSFGYATGDKVDEVTSSSETEPLLTMTYDSGNGALASVKHGDDTGDPVTAYAYASSAKYVTTETSAEGEETDYTYDSSKRVTQIIAPAHQGTDGIRYTIATYGNRTTVTDTLDNETDLAYDQFGNRTSVTDPLANLTSTEFDELGRMTAAEDGNANRTEYTWAGTGCSCSSSGNLVEIKDALDNITAYEYDDNDNRTKSTDPMGVETDYIYDDHGRLVQIGQDWNSGTSTYNVLTTMVYNALNQLVSKTDPEGNETTMTYDHMGRMVTTTDDVGTTTSGYDTLGRLVSVTDGNSHTWTYDYDEYGRLIEQVDPIGKEVHYTYDAEGRVLTVGAGTTGTFDPTEYVYDATTGLLDEVNYTSGANVATANYVYDDAGRLIQILDWIDDTNGIQYAYDDAGRLTTITDYDLSDLTYAYDDAGNVTSMTDYHGNTTTYTYTDLNQLDTLTAPGSRVWDWTYNDNGQPTQYTHPNEMITAYTYDNLNRQELINHKYDATTTAQSFDYEFDLGGNITRVTHEDGSYWDYEYDSRDRLTFAERRDDTDTFEYSEEYTYDDGDNMTQKIVTEAGESPVTISFTVNNANELTAMTGLTFAYDAWGRQTEKDDGTHTAEYAYHYGSKVTGATSDFPTEGNVDYTYGADQKRRSRDDGTNYTGYRWDIGFNVIEEENDQSELTRSYVVGYTPIFVPFVESIETFTPILRSPVGTIVADVAGVSPATGSVQYYAHDHLRSTRGIYSSASQQGGKWESKPYGEEYSNSLPSEIRHRFSGRELDILTDMYYTAYRMYLADTGRWMTRDPLGMADGPNAYAYVMNEPIGGLDALGLESWGVWFTKILCQVFSKIPCPSAELAAACYAIHCVKGCQAVKGALNDGDYDLAVQLRTECEECMAKAGNVYDDL